MRQTAILLFLLGCVVGCEDDPVGPMYGQIDVSGWVGDVEISGPAIVLDDAPTGLQVPAGLSHLELGHHTVNLDVEGFDSNPAQAVVDLDHGEIEQIAFQLVAPAGLGFLWVRSQPSGAEVLVDGSETGEQTPALLALTAGSHTVTVQRAGYVVEPSGPQSVLVPEGGVVAADFTLTPESGGTTTRVVLAELFTATWCTYCPYSEEAIDRLADEYGQSYLAVLQYHPTVGADPFGTAETDEREQLYGAVASGLPQIYFEGTVNLQHSYDQTYDDYKAVVDSLLSVPASVEMNLHASLQGDTLGIEVALDPTGQVPAGSFECWVVVYEDNLEFSAPNGQNHFRYTVRDMLPVWDVSISGAESREWLASVDPAWKTDDLGVVAFLQSPTTHKVLQAARIDLP